MPSEVEIIRMHVSDVTTPATHPLPNTVISNFAYLVRAQGRVLLWDSGLGPPHAVLDGAYRPRRFDLAQLLESAGCSIRRVDVVANCHLHLDHCGGNFGFPGVPVVVQGTELADARRPGYSIPEWVDCEGVHFLVVDGEYEIFPGVRVVPTPGHTRGHQSLVITRPMGQSCSLVKQRTRPRSSSPRMRTDLRVWRWPAHEASP